MTISEDETIRTIRAALRRRSDKAWLVVGGRSGPRDWGWITITAPRGRCDKYERMADEDRNDLAKLLGLQLHEVDCDGVEVPASTERRQEYIARAEGRAPSVTGTPYWD